MHSTKISTAVLAALAAARGLDVRAEFDTTGLRQRAAELHESVQAIQARAQAENRDLTDEETTDAAAKLEEVRRIQARIKLAEDTEATRQALSGVQPRAYTPPAGPTPQRAESAARGSEPRITGVRDMSAEDGRRGFRHVGEFFRSVIASSARGGTVDPRLVVNAPSTFNQENVGADGGFMVPPDFVTEILRLANAEPSLYALTRKMTTSSFSATIPTDETTPWATTGVQVYWTAEGTDIKTSKAALKSTTIPTHKVAGLVPVTEEMMSDAAQIGSLIPQLFAEKIAFLRDDVILNGNGVGKPLGVLSSGAVKAIAKETSQPASTVLPANIFKIWTSIPQQMRSRAVWVLHPDVEQLLLPLSQPVTNVAGTENVGGWPLYIPPGTIGNSPEPRILGRPIFFHQAAPALSSAGDVGLYDFAQYLVLEKTDGIRTDVSMHVYFESDIQAIRVTLRMGGQPWITSTIADKNGSSTRSPFARLDAR